MKNLLLILVFFSFVFSVYGQQAIHDKAIVFQQERMVFKQWDKNKFNPKPNRILGIPTNPSWYLTWALHPDYPKLDRRPLSATGEQTQRLGLAAAMSISSNYYKEQSDTVKNIATTEITRISGALSGADPLYLLYYKKELKPLDTPEEDAFKNIDPEVVEYMSGNGSYTWYLDNMNSLAERYGFAKNLDMERGDRILMYHRIMLEMRKILNGWQYKLDMSQKMLAYRKYYERKTSGQIIISPPTTSEERLDQIINNRKVLQ